MNEKYDDEKVESKHIVHRFTLKIHKYMYKRHEQEEDYEKREGKHIMHQFTFKIHTYIALVICINMHLKTNTDYISLVK